MTTAERFGVLLRIMTAYGLGLFIANVLWLPIMGVLAIAFAFGSILYASPLLGVALLVGFLKASAISARPRLWAGCGAVAAFAIYLFIDPPASVAAIQRGELAATCALCAAVTFVLIGERHGPAAS